MILEIILPLVIDMGLPDISYLMCKGYGLVDHKSFCIITNEGGALISVADLTL